MDCFVASLLALNSGLPELSIQIMLRTRASAVRNDENGYIAAFHPRGRLGLVRLEP